MGAKLELGFVFLWTRQWRSRGRGRDQSKGANQYCRDLGQERPIYQEDWTKIDDVVVFSIIRSVEFQRNSVGSRPPQLPVDDHWP